MEHLDGQTLDALADLICGDGGPEYRQGWKLPLFFRRAGVECPDHDGSTRKWWTLERLQEYNRRPEEVERVLLRLAEPREYNADPEKVQAVLAALNRVLAIEGWAVELEGIAPVLRRRVPGLAPIAPAKPEWPDPPDFATIASDSSFAEILHKRWIEAQTCMSAGAHTASLVMIGSLLEGALLAVARAKPEAANRANACPKDKRDKPRPLEQWTLNHLIDVAHECGWIERDRKDFSHALRDYRNIVHPWHQRELRAAPDSDTCNICWGVAKAVLNDLGQA